MEKEQINKPFNEQLYRLIAMKLNKNPNEKIAPEELLKIESISLNAINFDRSPSGIELSAISLFPCLKKLTLSNYFISQADLNSIISLKNLESLKFFKADFAKDLDFSDFIGGLKHLMFDSCGKIEFDYPALSEICLTQTDIDFSRINLSKASSITITNGKISNVSDLTDFPNISSVNLDGSILYRADGEKVESIKVSTETKYSCKHEVRLYDR